MPSPVGHALGGAIVGLLMERRRTSRAMPLSVFAVVAMLPDLDFLWGRHNMETHSVGAAVSPGLSGAGVDARKNRGWPWRSLLAWSTHILFDWLGSDDTPPLGVMAFWPLTSTFYFADAFVSSRRSAALLVVEFRPAQRRAIAKEILILGPLFVLLRAFLLRGPLRSRHRGKGSRYRA